ncbi:MAG TPA: response regulator, partial [Candidatus Wallbacteria bacterium]|nr:response regulator [Candidatus Wallbacteria bacterium]
MNERKGILVVDDTLAALKLLTDTLIDEGFIVRPASSGEQALLSVLAEQPELILLDVRMPDMDGFEICRRLKEQPDTCDIPILFLSAATEMEERIKGFALGAVDYIVKPFQRDEMMARVRTHLQLSRLQSKLESMVEQRTAELNISKERLVTELAERMAAENSLKESEKRFRMMIESSPYAIALSDVNDNVEYLNAKFIKTFGYTLSDVPSVKNWWMLAYPDEEYRKTLIKLWKEKIDTAFKKHEEAEPILVNVTCKNGAVKIIEVSFNLIGDKSLVTFHDVTEKKQDEKRLKTSLQEKETLLRELYHRTKNNMQVICSLLSLKSLDTDDEKLKAEFREMESRIHSMALVHQKLYSSKNLSNINIKEYINDLADMLIKSYKIS